MTFDIRIQSSIIRMADPLGLNAVFSERRSPGTPKTPTLAMGIHGPLDRKTACDASRFQSSKSRQFRTPPAAARFRPIHF